MKGRPATGPGHYLRDVIYGALDGVITTLAVVAAVAGAALAPRIAVVLGLANLVADGLSMGASNYLGLKSELEQRGESVAHEMPLRHGLATFVAFAVAGAIPLSAFVLANGNGLALPIAAALASVTLFVVGAARARFIARSPWWSGFEMLVVGGLAGVAAYAVGELTRGLL